MKLPSVLWAASLAGAAAIIGYGAIRTEDGREIDRELFRAANAGHGPRADRYFAGVTELGSLYASTAAAAVLALTGRRRAAVTSITAACATWLTLQSVKRIVNRPRPSDADPEATRMLIARPMATSWPSSHPAVLTTFTRVASRELALGPGARAALSGLDLSVAGSRIYLGVHYPSDVASGLLFGRAVARLWPPRLGQRRSQSRSQSRSQRRSQRRR